MRVGGADPEAVQKALGQIADVIAVAIVEDGFELSTGADTNPRPAVAAAVVNNGWDLLELRPLDMSLEDIFLQLTTKEEEAA